MAASLFFSLASLFALVKAVRIEPSLHALTWKYNNIDFWAPVHLESSVHYLQSPAGELPASLSRRGALKSGGYLGCTVATFPPSASSLSGDVVENIIASFALDDVWSAEQFLDCLFIQHNATAASVPVDPSLATFITKHRVSTFFVSPSFDLKGFASTARVLTVVSSCNLDNGPYVATLPTCDEGSSMGMTPVYTLHADSYEAFMEGSIPDSKVPNKHQQLHVSLPGARLPHIIVPSRLASTRPDAGPLAGLRFAVKDIFHINGLKTSGGSRSYYQAFGYQNYTTETVQLTLDAGAQLVGKTKTIAFALGAPRNGMEVDYPDPWSARGDGYQNTGGSSSGSGAAVTAYDWIDFAIGSDTGGSVRFPARYGGLYGYKPSHAVFNITGILPAITEQDTPGFLARSPEIFTRVGRAWTAGKPLAPVSGLPRKMLRYADQPTNVSQPAAADLIETFFAAMASALDLDPVSASINMTAAFLSANISQTSPPETMTDFMRYVYSDQNSVQCWDQIGSPLAEAFSQIPGQKGAFPPVDPPVNISFADGQNATTRARYPESQRRRQVFGEWFNRVVLPANRETCSEYIFAHTYHGLPTTVKTDPATARLTGGWYDGVYTNYAGTPEIVVPVGQVQYWSAYTQRLEWQPVTVALGMAKGCDLLLFELADRLAEKGLLREVLPGMVAYAVEE
ncbi:amidase signature domain-containing protein [Apodospora peruviana]|uniref:Amidase signature domain-containing protein n=1 Tax=Apodospora peruviana TaxID=516989 RepID=A0AAE0I199_9PEZI|nr:amidase signature domain-containing protein [Apodospora peruviana]